MKRIVDLFVCIVCSFWPGPAYSAGPTQWEEIIDSERQLIEVDFNSIDRSDSCVSLWIKTTYKKSIDFYIDKHIDILRKNGIIEDRSKWINFKYSVSFIAFDIVNKGMTLLSIVHYNTDGTVIVRVDIPKEEQEMVPITPETLMSATFITLCSKIILDVDGRRFAIYIDEVDRFLEQYPNAVLLGVSDEFK